MSIFAKRINLLRLFSSHLRLSTTLQSTAIPNINSKEEGEPRYRVKIWNLPYTANENTVREFFHDCKVKKDSVQFEYMRKTRNAIAFLELESEEDQRKALKYFNKYIENRQVKVFRYAPSSSEEVNGPIYAVTLRGLPYNSSREDVVDFLKDCRVLHGIKGVTLLMQKDGLQMGSAFVNLESEADQLKALKLHKSMLKERYIEVRPRENKFAMMGFIHNQKVIPAKNSLKMEGLSYDCTTKDISEFFSPIQPSVIQIEENIDGTKKGSAIVNFDSPDLVKQALEKDYSKLKGRLIQLNAAQSTN